MSLSNKAASKVYFVTSNAVKVKNAQDALGRFRIEVEQIAMDLVESRSEDFNQVFSSQ